MQGNTAHLMQWIDQAAAPLLVLLLIAAAGGFFVHERWRLPVQDGTVAASLHAAGRWLAVGTLAALLLGWMVWNLVQGGGTASCAACVNWRALDRTVATWVQAQAGAPWVPAVRGVTQLGHLLWMAALGAVTSVWLLWRQAWLQLGVWVVGVAGVGLCVRGLKYSVGRERPEVRWVLEQGFSFPSGHSAGTLVCYGLMAWLCLGMARSPHAGGARLWTAVVVVVLAVGISRVVLGAHYVSDVLAGWLLGLAWLSLVVAAAEMAHYVAARRQAG